MSDLAILGFRYESEGVEKANKALDQVSQKAGKAEKATDALARASQSLDTATGQMLAELLKAVKAIEQNTAALSGLTSARGRAAASTEVAAAATAKAASVSMSFSHSLDLSAAAAQRSAVAITQAAAAARTYSTASTPLEAHVLAYRKAMETVPAVHGKVAGSTKQVQAQMLNLTRQFADVGVTAAMGMSPLMIAIQQGPQIAEALSLMKKEGVGLAGALRMLAGSAAPFLAAIAPLAAIAAAAGAGFLLLNRELQKGFPKDITDGLGLTAEQLKKVEGRTVTMGDVWKSTLDVMGKYLTSGPVGDALKWLAGAVTKTLDFIAKIMFEGTATFVGFWIGAYRTIALNWKNFPAAIGDAVVGAVNVTIDAVERMINGVVQALNMMKRGAGVFNPALALLPDIPQVELDQYKLKYSGAAKFIGQAFVSNFQQAKVEAEGAMRKIGTEIGAGALKLAQDRAKAEAGEAKATNDNNDAKKKLHLTEIKLIEAGKSFDANFVGRNQLVEKFNDDIVTTEKAMTGVAKAFHDAKTPVEQMLDLFDQMSFAAEGLGRALKTGDLSGLARDFGSIQKLFGKGEGSFGTLDFSGKVSSIAGIADGIGRAIGGKGGRALSGAATGAQLGTMIAPGIGTAVGAIVGALSTFLGGKKSNEGAGYDLRTGAFSGGSRTAETEAAARDVGSAVKAGQDALKAAGLNLTETINGVVLGTRDQTQIYTSLGKTLRSAVGDTAAAAEAALQQVLTSATFVDKAQEKLVRSMQATGKSFDEINAALAEYAAAQQMITAVNDQILQLTDPKAFDLQSVQRAYDDNKKAAQAAADAGYLTADQLSELYAQLAKLNGLQVADVLSKYGDDVIAGLTSNLKDAFDADSAAIKDHAQKFQAFADSLQSYSDQIRGAVTDTLGSGSLGATSRRFQNISSLAAQGDVGALGQFQGAAEAFRQASAQYAPDARTNQRNLAQIQSATQDALEAAKSQVTADEASLKVLQDQVAPYLSNIVQNTQSTVAALAALQAALSARNGGGGGAAAAGEDFNAAAYLAQNPDIAAAYAAGTYGAGGYSSVEDFAKAHYLVTGQGEIAAGTRLRGYASGTNSASAGWHWVGEQGPELMNFRGGEQVLPNSAVRGGSNDNAALAAAVNNLAGRLAKIEANTKKSADLLQRVTRDGNSLLTTAA